MAQLTFHGAVRQVTGSCYLIEANGARVLLECGMSQGGRKEDRAARNHFRFDPRSLHAVVVSHAHLDHSGMLPRLVAEGYAGPIYTTHDTADLLALMLKDSANLQERDAEWENRWRQRSGRPPVQPLYTLPDTLAALELRQPLPYAQPTMVAPGIELTFREAGHILGSATVEIAVHEDHGRTRRLVFSGDLGGPGSPLLRDPETINSADIVLLESTYGDRDHRNREDTLEELQGILDLAWKQGGNVLIPAFAVGRTQDLLYYLGKFYQAGTLKQRAVFLDSPMAIAATEIYDRYHHHFSDDDRALIGQTADGKLTSWLPVLKCTPTPKESMAINRITSGAIIIAGAGMCTGGRIMHHFKHNIWREECHVIMPGFQAAGTPGRRLVDGDKRLRILHQTFAVKAQIHTLGGFSAHAGQSQLIDWLSHFNTRPQVYLVHGELSRSEALAQAVETRLGWPAHIPELGESISF
ncbi:MBL fold metallo-hydrolase [Halopseudomonas nanhaiensis]|uniref:MBL fold metallo-hydrolase RNA specificity domain-containing protein n=1 Tax=Halopseudomonas nanhaiensis TaxID=2830842 RepID=UPI001CBD427B|nr:MBL fold metallo-hydrolase [Halopseudomonas nanhaiensis]UAW97611.1 MBL fold metallo-hydrolase [Halopseudomonas nanhaiensis]